MQLFKFSIEECIRNWKKAVLNLLICMITVILVASFFANIISINSQLKRLPEVIEIKVVISNLKGNMDSGIKITEDRVNGILTSQYVENPSFTVQLKAGFGSFTMENCQGKLNYLVTAGNSVATVPGLKEKDIHYMENMSEQEFFHSNQNICIMDEQLLKDENIKVGDDITLTNFYYNYKKDREDYIVCLEPFNTDTYKVVGTMNIKEYFGSNGQPDILMPFETIREKYHNNGFVFFADAGTFKVKDPFLLNEFKKEMHDLGFLPVIPRAEAKLDGYALAVRDDTFVRSAEQLLKSRKLMFGILPFILIAVLCIGFVMGILLMKSRRRQYAIMRSLGQSYRDSFLILVMEYALSALGGSLFGVLFSVLFLHAQFFTAILAAGGFFFCYMSGNMAALTALKKLSVMEVLSRND